MTDMQVVNVAKVDQEWLAVMASNYERLGTMNFSHVVYRLYDSNRTLLYVGVTNDVTKRLEWLVAEKRRDRA